MKLKKTTVTKWADEESGFDFKFEPLDLDEPLSIKKTKTGYEVKYLTPDECYDTSFLTEDDQLFLVNYHRDFFVEKKGIVCEDDLREFYQGQKIMQEKEYWIFPVSALIHSGVWLSLSHSFACDSQGWDTSHVGAIFASKREWKTEKLAQKAVEGLVETWNMVLSNEVFCCVKETYDKDKKPLNYDIVGGFIGLKYAIEELKGF